MLGSVHRGEDGPHHLFEKTSRDLEGIDRVALRRAIDAWLQGSGIHDIDPARKQLRDRPFDRNEVEHGKAIRVFDLDQDVEIAIGPPSPAIRSQKPRLAEYLVPLSTARWRRRIRSASSRSIMIAL